MMKDFRKDGTLPLSPQALQQLRASFAAGSADDAATRGTIAAIYKETGMLIDPHTAVGVSVGRALPRKAGTTLVTLATAHPAKFPDVVKEATGIDPTLPSHLHGIMEREERSHIIENHMRDVQSFIEKHI